MAHAMASAAISFGLVTIPVKVYSANRSSESISFNLLHNKCRSRLKQQYICQTEDEIVERSDMVKGYEFAKGQYVLFSDEELKALEEKSTQTIEITEFVPIDTVDPIFFDKPYYLGPDTHGTRAYALLSRAMQETGRCGLAHYTARGKQYLVMLRPIGNGLVMQQLHYQSEIRSFSEIEVSDDVEVKEQELKLAIMLADQVTAERFRPDEYSDPGQVKLREIIQKKIEGEEVSMFEPEEPRAKVIDLMEALRASLGQGSVKKPKSESREAEIDRKPAKRAAPRLEEKRPRAAVAQKKGKAAR